MRLPLPITLLIVGGTIVAIAAVTLLGRGVLGPFMGDMFDAKAQAEQVVDAYYAAEQAGDIDTAMSYFSPRTVQRATPDKLRATLQNKRSTLGPQQSHQETAFNVQKSGQVTTAELTYNVVYGQRSGTEHFTLVRANGSSSMQIDAYDFNVK